MDGIPELDRGLTRCTGPSHRVDPAAGRTRHDLRYHGWILGTIVFLGMTTFSFLALTTTTTTTAAAATATASAAHDDVP
jgi:drug/metabolite transporter (DMT)-like permease